MHQQQAAAATARTGRPQPKKKFVSGSGVALYLHHAKHLILLLLLIRPPMKSTTAIFWKSFVKHPRYTGAIAPSSEKLAQGMLSRTDLRTARFVVELGPGTGAFTTSILAALPPGAELLAIERNPELASFLRYRLPRARVVCDDAANLERYLANHPQPPAAIFCGLPLSWLPARERTRILDVVAAALAPGSTFTLFQYVHAAPTPPGQQVRRALQARFQHVERFPIWWNLPPAYVVHCTK